jgi:hypothetical protein
MVGPLSRISSETSLSPSSPCLEKTQIALESPSGRIIMYSYYTPSHLIYTDGAPGHRVQTHKIYNSNPALGNNSSGTLNGHLPFLSNIRQIRLILKHKHLTLVATRIGSIWVLNRG